MIDLVKGLLGGIGFDEFLAKFGLSFGQQKTSPTGQPKLVDRPSALVGVIVQVGIVLIAIVQVLATVGLAVWSTMVSEFLSYTFLNVLVAVVIMGIGATANVELAQRAGLALGPTGGIAVDRTMRTQDGHIFACGDCAEKVSFFDGTPCPLKLASIATSEARIAGANLFETRRQNIGTIGVWSTVVAETAFATAGLTEGLAERHGYNYVRGWLRPRTDIRRVCRASLPE